jgi:hypothetical protein
MRRHLPPVLSLVALALATLPVRTREVHAASKPLVVIVSSALPMRDISFSQLRNAFLGEGAEYASGKRLIAVNHPPGSPVRGQFDLTVLGLKPDAVGRFWVERRIRDQPGPPKAVPSIDLALRLTMSLPGAITYVPPELVNPKVRALTIDGKAAGERGYPLE